jgi:hypothetical protein
VEDFKQELNNFKALYPNMSLLAVRHMNTYLNLKLAAAFEIEPTFTGEDASSNFKSFIISSLFPLIVLSISTFTSIYQRNLFENIRKLALIFVIFIFIQ